MGKERWIVTSDEQQCLLSDLVPTFLTFSLSGLVFVGESHLQLQQPQLCFFLVCHPDR